MGRIDGIVSKLNRTNFDFILELASLALQGG